MFLVIGNGKTGHEVAKLIPQGQLLEVCTTQTPPTLALMQKASCIIVFVPTDAFDGRKPLLIQAARPVVIGTTGITLQSDLPVKAPWIIGSNFSVGVNLMFQFAQSIPKTLIRKVSIYEEHHAGKKDSPSGSALYLKNLFPDSDVEIEAKREGDIQAAYKLTVEMQGEVLTLTHQALDRKIYAKGALLAALNIEQYQPGIYRFEEIFDTLVN